MPSEASRRPLKELAREIFLATLAEVDVGRAFDRKLQQRRGTLYFGTESVDLNAFKRIWVISFGKAAWATLRSLQEVLGEDYQPDRGVVVSNVPPPVEIPGFRAYQGGHPVPNAASLEAADTILQLLGEADQQTLVFFLISGGGSALVEKPLDFARGKPVEKGLTLEDMQLLHRALVGCGAPIDDINAVRKHLSAIKGGRLAAAASRAHKVTLLISDVPEGRSATIASGPTLPDPSSVETCYEVAARYNLLAQFPPTIQELFQKQKLSETPQEGAEAFQRAQSFVVLSNRDVLHAGHRTAGAHGFLAECELRCDDWELDRAAELLIERLEEMRQQNPGQPVALVSGGEILCPVTGDGQGGRNQAFVLHCVEKIAGREWAMLSAGTDGVDGNSPAAGAVADGQSLARAKEKNLNPQDYFRRSDSFNFFEGLGDSILTGPQQNNLRDLRLLLAR
jgi:hydroxypyruvate reductase